MAGSEFFNLTLSLQAALGAGYLGYATAYAGYRRDHRSEDALFISLAFAAVAMLAFGAVEAFLGSVWAVIAAVSASLAAACAWRVVGRRLWLQAMSASRIHRDDGVHAGWTGIIQSMGAVGQISVHLKGGGVLYLNDRRNFDGSPWGGLYLGGDGAIIMAVEEEELPDGVEEIREGIIDQDWGTRLTYIPASEVKRVNIRIK